MFALIDTDQDQQMSETEFTNMPAINVPVDCAQCADSGTGFGFGSGSGAPAAVDRGPLSSQTITCLFNEVNTDGARGGWGRSVIASSRLRVRVRWRADSHRVAW